jgi:hypothetical protein
VVVSVEFPSPDTSLHKAVYTFIRPENIIIGVVAVLHLAVTAISAKMDD